MHASITRLLGRKVLRFTHRLFHLHVIMPVSFCCSSECCVVHVIAKTVLTFTGRGILESSPMMIMMEADYGIGCV